MAADRTAAQPANQGLPVRRVSPAAAELARQRVVTAVAALRAARRPVTGSNAAASRWIRLAMPRTAGIAITIVRF
jgi:hypothetical protein